MARVLSQVKRRRLAEELAQTICEGAFPPSTMVRFTGWSETQIKLQASFVAFDRLPKSLRHALHETTVTFEPGPIASWWQANRVLGTPGRMSRIGIRLIRQGEMDDLRDFAGAYRRRYGQMLPHLAAEASILRYDQPRTRRKLSRDGRP
jgi:hypothetical protein